MIRIDLNSDVGESFSRWTLGDDAALLAIVSSANIACGFHAGDPRGIRSTLELAATNGVTVGAHVGYRDLAGFGRRDLDVAPDELTAETIYQIGALQALAASVGTRVSYVKPHGALYNRIVHDQVQAEAVVAAVVHLADELGRPIPLLGLGGAVEAATSAAGVPFVREAFLDRGYMPDGTLVPRDHPGAVLDSAEHVAARAVRLVNDGVVEAIDGTLVRVDAASLCVHGDTPAAVAMAAAVRAALASEGIEVRAPW